MLLGVRYEHLQLFFLIYPLRYATHTKKYLRAYLAAMVTLLLGFSTSVLAKKYLAVDRQTSYLIFSLNSNIHSAI